MGMSARSRMRSKKSYGNHLLLLSHCSAKLFPFHNCCSLVILPVWSKTPHSGICDVISHE
jgi:hypothetical protein